MACHAAVSPRLAGEGQPRLEVADIFRRFGPAYRQSHRLTDAQRKVMWCIENCRTPALGTSAYVCADCGHENPQFNSCGNRHCPKCPAPAQAEWIAQRQRRVLPVRHFHVVTTLPAQLRPVVAANRKPVFNLLFRSSADMLLDLGANPKRLGAQLGITAVLHTWTRELAFHPHLHCIVTAGGLTNDDTPRWLHSAPNFLFHVNVMSELFRGKFLDGLKQLHQQQELVVPVAGDGLPVDTHFQRLLDELYDLDWNVYCEEPLGGPEHVFRYLGRYTHRVAISNQRLISIDDDAICFLTKDGNTLSLPPKEFIRRFLMHVLPNGFTKIRHYGLMASANVNTRLEVARALLDPDGKTHRSDADCSWQIVLLEFAGIDLLSCPSCGSTNISRRSIDPRPVRPWDTS